MNFTIIASAVTPFSDNGDLDVAGIEKLYGALAVSGVDGIFLAGTTGEFVTLSKEERLTLFKYGHRILSGKRVIAHIGSLDRRTTISLLEGAREFEIKEFAAVTPFYGNFDFDVILDYFERIAECLLEGEKLFIYHYPGLTGTKLSVPQVLRLCRIPGIAGIKLSGVDLQTADAIARPLSGESEVLTGNDFDVVRIDTVDVSGIVSGIYPVVPELFEQLRSSESTASLILGSSDLRRSVANAVQFITGDVARIKYALSCKGLICLQTRMPVRILTERERAEIRAFCGIVRPLEASRE